MASLRYTVRCLRDLRPATPSQCTLTYRPKLSRSLATTASRSTDTADNEITKGLRVEMEEMSLAKSVLKEVSSSSSSGAVVRSRNSTFYVPYARAVPVSPSYFSRQPYFNDSFVVVQELARKYARLPVLPRDKVAPTAWRTKEQYRLAIGEHVKGRDYATCMKLAKRLNQIHPDLMPAEVTAGLAPFKREVNHYLNRPKEIPIDRFGRAHGAGKRKSSVARAWVVEGTGEVLVNGKPLSEAFGRIHDRESAVWALKSTERLDKYNVWATVEGGGTTGQAEALTLAIAKALCTHEPDLKNPLRRGMFAPKAQAATSTPPLPPFSLHSPLLGPLAPAAGDNVALLLPLLKLVTPYIVRLKSNFPSPYPSVPLSRHYQR
jgi:small subunit ribosomal protein S9